MYRPFLAVALVLGFSPIATFPTSHGHQAAPAESLFASSRTICVLATDADLQTSIAERLVEWGRLTVVPRPDRADLVLHVSEKESLKVYSEIRPDDPPGRRWAVRVTHRATARELWSATKGDGAWGEAGSAAFAQRATAWRAREITNDFVKYFNKTMRKGKGKA